MASSYVHTYDCRKVVTLVNSGKNDEGDAKQRKEKAPDKVQGLHTLSTHRVRFLMIVIDKL